MLSIADEEANLDIEEKARLSRTLEACARIYRRLRLSDELWKYCEGKQVFRAISQDLGFADAQAAEGAIFVAWESDDALVPDEVRQIRDYVNGI